MAKPPKNGVRKVVFLTEVDFRRVRSGGNSGSTNSSSCNFFLFNSRPIKYWYYNACSYQWQYQNKSNFSVFLVSRDSKSWKNLEKELVTNLIMPISCEFCDKKYKIQEKMGEYKSVARFFLP